ncbi:MAG: CDP-diacylglycerol--glycerol-3-phosphate 3-phosphatidyltransferase, partial [Candidatus Subteraquimicrobiales bacterium]|nr:CDP-diacylglycerol--glycerol-3-phosphate 3-phosphatidyltransferase [Candidatus Subteraquimicrobiales bacterium]
KRITTFGKFIDPLADKLLVSAALIVLVDLNRLASWIAIIIIAREFAVSGLRLIVVAEGKIITASILGKIKTFFQVAAIIAFILNFPLWGKSVSWALMAIAVLLTVISGIDYFLKNIDIFKSKGQ